MARTRTFSDEEFLAAYEAKKADVWEIAEVLACTPGTVYVHARRLGKNIHGDTRKVANWIAIPLINEYVNLVTVEELATKHGESPYRIKLLLKMGLSAMWNVTTPPAWAKPETLPEIKVYNLFSTHTEWWDADDAQVATVLGIRARHVAAYRTRVATISSSPIHRKLGKYRQYNKLPEHHKVVLGPLAQAKLDRYREEERIELARIAAEKQAAEEAAAPIPIKRPTVTKKVLSKQAK